MRTTPPCALDNVTVMPSTARWNEGCTVFQIMGVPSEELLFAFDEEDETGFEEELLAFSEEEDIASLEDDSITELLETLLEENLISDELDSTEVELDDSALELLDNPNFE